MNEVAADLVGRQFGEDLCMILLTIWILPITQFYLFPQIYPLSSDSLPFPSYEQIGTTIIGTAFFTETILTILTFSVLMHIGIPLPDNTVGK